MLQQNNQNQIYVNPQLSNTFQLEVAKRLSESMADNQPWSFSLAIFYIKWVIWRLLRLKYSKIHQKLKPTPIIF